MLPSGSTLHHSNMLFPEEDRPSIKHVFQLCTAHSEVKGKQMKAKQRGYPESWPLLSVFLALSCHAVVGSLLGWVVSLWMCDYILVCSRNKFIRYRVLYVAYKFLHLTVVLFRRRETPLVLQADVRRSVKERIHLRHSVQTGQGLEKENVIRCKALWKTLYSKTGWMISS